MISCFPRSRINNLNVLKTKWQDMVCAGVDIPGHSAALPQDADEIDQAFLERERMRRLACALPEVAKLS